MTKKTFFEFIKKNNFYFIIIFFSLTFSALFSFLLNVFIARNFSQEIFGSFSSTIYIATMFSAFVILGFDGFLINVYSREKKKFYSYLPKIFTLIFISFIIFISIYLLITIFSPSSDFTKKLMIFFIVFIISNALIDLLKSIYQIQEEFYKLSIINFLPQFFRLVFVIFFFLVFKFQDEIYLVYSYLITGFIFILYSKYKIFKFFLKETFNKNFFFDLNSSLNLLKKTSYYNIGKLLAYINITIEIIYIKYFINDASVGIFNAAYILILGTFIISDAYSKLFTKNYFYLSKKNISLLRINFFNGTFFLIFSSIILATIMAIFSDQIIYFIYGTKYIYSSKILLYLSILIPLRYLVTNSIMLLRVYNYGYFETVSLFIVVIFKIIFVYIFIKYLGLMGAVLGIILGELIFLVFNIVFILKSKLL